MTNYKTTLHINYVDGSSYTARDCVFSSFEELPLVHSKSFIGVNQFVYKQEEDKKGMRKLNEYILNLANIRSITKTRGNLRTLWLNPNVTSSVKIEVTSPYAASVLKPEIVIEKPKGKSKKTLQISDEIVAPIVKTKTVPKKKPISLKANK